LLKASVFIHDTLDHFLSDFGVSGHRSEAMALIQLSRRTDASPEADYRQNLPNDSPPLLALTVLLFF